MITSPHNAEAQGDPQAPPAAALARARRPVRGRGRGPAGGRRRRRLGRRRARTARRAAGLPAIEVEPAAAARRLRARLGHRALAVYEERWAPAPLGPLCVYLHGVHDPGNVGTRAAQRPGVRRLVGGARTRDRRPVQPQGGAGQHGRGVRGPARGADVGQLPGAKIALVAGAGEPLCRWRSDYVSGSRSAIGARSSVGSSATGSPTRSSRRRRRRARSRSPPTRSTPRWRRRSRCTN